MVKSAIAGAATGAFLSVVSLGVASLIAPQPAGNTPPAPPQQVARQGEAPAPDAVPGSVPPAAEAPRPGAAGPVLDTAEAPAAGPGIDTDPAPMPDVSDAPQSMAPASDTALSGLPAAGQAVLPAPQTREPILPEGERDLSISTDPVQPVLPDAPGEVFVAVPGAGAPLVPGVTPGAPGAEPMARPEGMPAPQVLTLDGAEAPSGAAPQTGGAALPPPPMDIPEASPDAPRAEDDLAMPAAPGAVPLAEDMAAPRPAVRAAPTGGSTLAPEAPLALEGASETPTEDAAQAGAAPLPRDAYAAPFAGVDPDLPKLSVILVDDGGTGLGPEAVSALPVPVTIALSPLAGDASARLSAYRAARFEALNLVDFPAGATAQDVAVMSEAAFAMLPETIGLMTLDPASLSRDGTQSLVDALARDGRSLVSADVGLNGVQRAAQEAALPVMLIYRDLDGDGQDARTMRRFLDQAAFQARNAGAVVVMARLRPDTVSALDLWSLAERAQSVQIVPVSVLLNAGEG